MGRAGNESNPLLYTVESEIQNGSVGASMIKCEDKYLTNRPMIIPCAKIFETGPTLALFPGSPERKISRSRAEEPGNEASPTLYYI